MTQLMLCSFTYTAFALAFIYLVLFFFVLRYLVNLMRQNARGKKVAQKVFLAILIAQTLLRVLYFLLFPFNNSSCHPANSGEARETTTSAAWWIHLLSNLPAELFLLAFSVLVFTFARIYHRVLLAGVWFQERRFKMVTCALGVLNVFAFTVCFGDWAYAASDPHSGLQAFESILLYCVTCVSALLACMFLAYGGLLFFQVQAIIRASSESVAHGGGTSSFMPPSKTQSRVGANGYAPLRGGRNGAFLPAGSFSNQTRPQSLLLPSNSANGGQGGGGDAFSHSAAAPLIPNMSFVASDAGTGFTPNHAATAAKKEQQQQQQQQRRNGQAEGERADHDVDEPVSPDGQSYDEGASDCLAPAPPAGVGNGLRTGTGTSFPPSTGFQPRAQGQSPSSDNSSHNGLNGFASPNLPIGARSTGGAGGEVVVAHSYVSSIGGSVSPSAVGGGGPGAPGGANGDKGATGAAAGSQKLPSGYASSVSPEYSQLPNSTKARTGHAQHSRAVITSPNGTTQIIATTAAANNSGTPNTPTDQLVGSMQAAPVTPVRSSHRGATSSLARQSPVTPTSSRIASQQPRYSPNDSLETVNDDSIEVTNNAAGGQPGKQGLTNAHYSYQMNGYEGGGGGAGGAGAGGAYQSAGRGKGASNPLNSVVAARYDENSYRDRGDDSSMGAQHTGSALLLPASPPPNPMRKIAVIAAICTACLIARAILLAVVMGCGLDFNAGTTLIYFATSEIFPLVFMLRVFNTPSPLV